MRAASEMMTDARRFLTARERALLDQMAEWPVALARLSEADLLEAARVVARGMVSSGELSREIGDTREEERATLALELIARTASSLVADECERRRTGIAPRAKRMN